MRLDRQLARVASVTPICCVTSAGVSFRAPRSGVFIAVFPTSPRTDLAFAPPQEFPRPIVDPGHAEGTIVDDHVLNYPSSDLMDVLTGKKSFQEALQFPSVKL